MKDVISFTKEAGVPEAQFWYFTTYSIVFQPTCVGSGYVRLYDYILAFFFRIGRHLDASKLSAILTELADRNVD